MRLSTPFRKFSCELPALKLMPDLAEFMTVKEAAQELGFSATGIHKLIRKSKLEAVFFGRMYLVSKKSVKEYLDQTRGMSKNDPTRGKQPKEQ
jgi:excisionase family DNA binding protein